MPQKPLVAIVDDDESIRDSTKDLLDAAGFAAATFPSAESFLQVEPSRQHRPAWSRTCACPG